MSVIFEHAAQAQPVLKYRYRYKIAQVQDILLNFITNMVHFGYFNVLYSLSRL